MNSTIYLADSPCKKVLVAVYQGVHEPVWSKFLKLNEGERHANAIVPHRIEHPQLLAHGDKLVWVMKVKKALAEAGSAEESALRGVAEFVSCRFHTRAHGITQVMLDAAYVLVCTRVPLVEMV